MKKVLLTLITTGCVCFVLGQNQIKKNTYDYVIKGGTVIDPETSFNAVRNVGIIKDKIAIITKDNIQGIRVFDAKGLIVAPGFIDLHAHGQNTVADRMQAFDGVTTSLELESGVLPIADWYNQQKTANRVLNYGASAGWTSARIAEMEGMAPKADLKWLQQSFSYSKWVNEPANEKQVQKILDHLERGIKEGSIGIGINAGYAPGGGYKELLQVHILAGKYKVPTFTHISGDFPDDPNSAVESVGDIISFSTIANSQDHICHLNSSSLKDVNTTRSMILEAQKKGLDITTESYTYGASSTTIGAALFTPEAIRRKDIHYESLMRNGVNFNEQTFLKTRKDSPGEVIVFNFLQLPKEEPLLDESVLFPGGAIASDAMPWINTKTNDLTDSNKWPLTKEDYAHPRSAGTYTRLLSHWVRERKAISLSEAIRKASLIPAQILEKSISQMRNKGRLQVGMDADIIVFDLNTVQDKATFTEPYHPSEGMKYVFVNGVSVIEKGQLNLDKKPGKPIRRISTDN